MPEIKRTPMEQVVEDACKQIEGTVVSLYRQAQANIAHHFPPRDREAK